MKTVLKESFVQNLLQTAGSPEKAVDFLLSQVPENPVDARLDLQVLLNTLGREEESFAVSLQLAEIAPQDPRVLFNHGWHLLKRGELLRGLSFLEFGRPLGTYGHPPLLSSQPLWTPERGHNQHVLLVLEGGFGDELIHFRFGKKLVEQYNCKVTVICNPALAPFLASQSWVSAVAQREAALGIFHDSWLPGMSAALALGLEYKDISGDPYLEVRNTEQEKWNSLIGTHAGQKLKVGIRWAGNPQFEHQQYRLFPANILIDLKEFSELQLFSFQRDDHLQELPQEIVDLGPQLKTWDDTAAALNEMDLVISSCTSVAHLSGALGKPTWILTPALPYFIWALPGNTSPWYKSVRLFRQSQFGDWSDVRISLRNELKIWLSQNQKLAT
jgi:hypothetical protein